MTEPDPKVPQGSASGRAWMVLMILVFVLLMFIGIFVTGTVDRFRDQVFARGLITFVVSISTIGIAFLLIYQAFFSSESSDDRFRRGREIFTGLMGVLGTIVGFYFGNADKDTSRMVLAPIRIESQKLLTHVSGGAAPYAYSVDFTQKGVEGAKERVSRDGWITLDLDGKLNSGKASLNVRDAKEQRLSAETQIPGPEPAKEQSVAPAVPAKPGSVGKAP